MAGGIATLAGLGATFLFAQFSGPPVSVLDSIMLGLTLWLSPEAGRPASDG